MTCSVSRQSSVFVNLASISLLMSNSLLKTLSRYKPEVIWLLQASLPIVHIHGETQSEGWEGDRQTADMGLLGMCLSS